MKKTIFVVDDSQLILQSAKKTLRANYNVIVVPSAKDMFSALEGAIPSLILLDIEMPEMSGFEALEIMKENSTYSNIPVILLTAINNIATEVRGFELGAVDFVAKPFSSLTLSNRIELHINIDEHIKAREAELIKSNNELEEARNKAMEAEIANESNKAKSEFLARMSHEIRTPISAILGISEIQLRNPDLPPFVGESFIKINNSSHMLLGLVNDLLDISKIEAGKMDLISEEYEIAMLINNIKQIYSTLIGNKPIEFRMFVDRNLPSLLIGDYVRINQIITNILSNAIKYTESGTVEFSIHCMDSFSSEYDATLAISILDTGMGMTQEQLSSLSTEYTRFHESQNRSITGTGLGMNIVYHLAQIMDGHVDIASQVGKGTTVAVYIPQKISNPKIIGLQESEKLQQFQISSYDAAGKFEFTPEPMPYGRVLIVDDVNTNLYVARGLMDFYSLNIETCDSGKAAIEKVEAGNEYDIIFMDHMMPEMDGIETMLHLRQMGYTEPIIALTANAMIGQAEEFKEKGFDEFLSKPIRTKYLNQALIQYVKDKQPPSVIEAASKAQAAAKGKGSIEDFQKNADMLRKMRKDFSSGHQNTFANIIQALESNDKETATLLAHTVKGLAGLIQEPALAQHAGRLEATLNSGSTPSEALIYSLKTQFEHVLQSIGKPEVFATVFNADINKEEVTKLFEKLEILLKSRDTACLELLDSLKIMPEATIIVKQIEDYEFSLALSNLTTLRSALDL